MKTIYTDVVEGEWIAPKLRGYKLACCGCGLTHKLDFRVKDGRPELRFFRAPRETAAVRRERRRRGEKNF